MYKEIKNEKLKEEIINSELFKECNYDDLSIDNITIQARYTSDNYCDKVLFTTEFWLQPGKDKKWVEKFNPLVADFIAILKNRKYHLDPDCSDGLGLDITKNVNLLITVITDVCEPPTYFIFII